VLLGLVLRRLVLLGGRTLLTELRHEWRGPSRRDQANSGCVLCRVLLRPRAQLHFGSAHSVLSSATVSAADIATPPVLFPAPPRRRELR
jgi:hypothetical protein